MIEAQSKLGLFFLNVLFDHGFVLFGAAVLDMYVFRKKMYDEDGYRVSPGAEFLPNDYDILMPRAYGSIENLQQRLDELFQGKNLTFRIGAQGYGTLLTTGDEHYKIKVIDYMGLSIMTDFVFLKDKPILGRFDFDTTSLRTVDTYHYSQIDHGAVNITKLLKKRMDKKFSVIHDFGAYTSWKKALIARSMILRIIKKIMNGFQLVDDSTHELIVKPGAFANYGARPLESILVLHYMDPVYTEFTIDEIKTALEEAWEETLLETSFDVEFLAAFEDNVDPNVYKSFYNEHNASQIQFVSSVLPAFYRRLNDCRPWI